MNEAIRNLLERRSIRSYDARPVPDDVLDAILEAGLHAPSGMNTQGVRLVAVRDPETVAYMSKLNAAVMGRDGDPFYGASCVVVVLADPEIYGGWVEDGALALGNMMRYSRWSFFPPQHRFRGYYKLLREHCEGPLPA